MGTMDPREEAEEVIMPEDDITMDHLHHLDYLDTKDLLHHQDLIDLLNMVIGINIMGLHHLDHQVLTDIDVPFHSRLRLRLPLQDMDMDMDMGMGIVALHPHLLRQAMITKMGIMDLDTLFLDITGPRALMVKPTEALLVLTVVPPLHPRAVDIDQGSLLT
jgi:hypothetical protein